MVFEKTVEECECDQPAVVNGMVGGRCMALLNLSSNFKPMFW